MGSEMIPLIFRAALAYLAAPLLSSDDAAAAAAAAATFYQTPVPSQSSSLLDSCKFALPTRRRRLWVKRASMCLISVSSSGTFNGDEAIRGTYLAKEAVVSVGSRGGAHPPAMLSSGASPKYIGKKRVRVRALLVRHGTVVVPHQLVELSAAGGGNRKYRRR